MGKKKKRKQIKKNSEEQINTIWLGFNKNFHPFDFEAREKFLICKCQQVNEQVKRDLDADFKQFIQEESEKIPIEERHDYILTANYGKCEIGEWLIFSDDGVFGSFKQLEDAFKFAQEKLGVIKWSSPFMTNL